MKNLTKEQIVDEWERETDKWSTPVKGSVTRDQLEKIIMQSLWAKSITEKRNKGIELAENLKIKFRKVENDSYDIKMLYDCNLLNNNIPMKIDGNISFESVSLTLLVGQTIDYFEQGGFKYKEIGESCMEVTESLIEDGKVTASRKMHKAAGEIGASTFIMRGMAYYCFDPQKIVGNWNLKKGRGNG